MNSSERRLTMAGRADHDARYVLFDTDLGACGLAWTARGAARLALPEAETAATEARLVAAGADRFDGEMPSDIAAAVRLVREFLSGRETDLSPIALDLAGIEPFEAAVYDEARTIGWGETTTYGDLARRVGAPGAARAVGRAMARNPLPLIIPCHRVLAAGGGQGGFSAYGGVMTKERLLAQEGVHPGGTPRLPGLFA